MIFLGVIFVHGEFIFGCKKQPFFLVRFMGGGGGTKNVLILSKMLQ